MVKFIISLAFNDLLLLSIASDTPRSAEVAGNLSRPGAIQRSATSQPGGRSCSDLSLSPSLRR